MLSQCRCPHLHPLLPTTVAPPWDRELRDLDLARPGLEVPDDTVQPVSYRQHDIDPKMRNLLQKGSAHFPSSKQLHCQPNNGTNDTPSQSAKLPISHCQVRCQNQPPNCDFEKWDTLLCQTLPFDTTYTPQTQ